ncbi:hypothetical protein EU805_10455 [Salipiger sp. IMCC34102]|uniref:hypothetical protein n=1 Tax=Salipiger sp. IMCC34102 TaxID=2510647 RepID=UPI00101CC697|nr:hypothetical protein [Salipiger sp. IMCC34102]RYH02263.1 hypothetical protein EU805_10455 [Salipiger sp. IMCC34102]
MNKSEAPFLAAGVLEMEKSRKIRRKWLLFRQNLALTYIQSMRWISLPLFWLSESFKWTTIRSICGSRVAQATTLLPILGFLVLYNQNLEPILQLQKGGSTGFESLDHFMNSRLDILYLGVITFGLCIILFNVTCPVIVKKHRSAQEFASVRLENSNSFDIIQSLHYLEKVLDRNLKVYLFYLNFMGGGKKRIRARREIRETNFIYFPTGLCHRMMSWVGMISSEFKGDAQPEISKLGFDLAATLNPPGRGWLNRTQEESVRIALDKFDELGNALIVQRVSNLGYDVYSIHFACKNRSKFLLRYVVMILMAIGIVLMFAPTFLTILYAINKLKIAVF